ncbi:MAG: hypothetical protein LIP02_01195 [Bacteroidales bacterium]|nr:hypothetical protein [Bacteroidales bacterium]
MKFLKFFSAAILAVAMTACGNSNKSDAQAETAEAEALSVDALLVAPDSLVGQTITIEGVCSHLCKHGGRKAFVAGSTDGNIIRCEATAEMGGYFPKETIHRPIRVTGVLVEERIDSTVVAQLEEQAKTMSDCESGCETERKAQGQAELTTLADRVADYRAKIAERTEKEGKPYISFYYINSTNYEILGE